MPRLLLPFLRLLMSLTLTASFSAASETAEARPAHQPGMANPILPGYYADPSLVEYEGRYYLYATLDPWGDETLGCWESTDFRSWTFRELNWPTKTRCTSPTSKGAGVWAPSVVRGGDGRFYMYVSVGNEVWAGVAEHPLGPWRDALGGRPLIPGDYRPGFHMIDAEAFIDDDGQAYLYWGSGWNWVNGKCFAVRLAPDMTTFVGEVRDVTPPRYFEAPFMIKRGGRYHLMYSSGKTPEDTYQVHSAVSDSHFGPFTEEAASPVLVTDRTKDVISPGHHAVFEREGKLYILYHRHSVPFDPQFIGRQICVDELRFDADGNMLAVTPTHQGPAWLARGPRCDAHASASSQATPTHGAGRVLDDNNATWWRAAADDTAPWLRLDFAAAREITTLAITPEYAWKDVRFRVEATLDGENWRVIANHEANPLRGSPLRISVGSEARSLRIVFTPHKGLPVSAVTEISVE